MTKLVNPMTLTELSELSLQVSEWSAAVEQIRISILNTEAIQRGVERALRRDDKLMFEQRLVLNRCKEKIEEMKVMHAESLQKLKDIRYWFDLGVENI